MIATATTLSGETVYEGKCPRVAGAVVAAYWRKHIPTRGNLLSIGIRGNCKDCIRGVPVSCRLHENAMPKRSPISDFHPINI